MSSQITAGDVSKRSAFLQSLVDRIHSSAKAETVFGASREEGGRTILPVARVWYGFGGGYSSARKKGEPVAEAPDEGGGGGIRLIPVGVFDLTELGPRFIPVTDSKVLVLSALLGGLLLGVLMRQAAQSTRRHPAGVGARRR
jgi:uncharacterized spore protein YtfJ